MNDQLIIDDAIVLLSLCPEAQWNMSGSYIIWEEELDESGEKTGNILPTNLTWFSDSISIPSKQEIEEETTRQVDRWVATEYQRLRQPEYPPLADLADALYWQAQGDESKMTAYLAAVDAVKQKYPKGV